MTGRLVRDGSTWLVYTVVAVWGYFLFGFGPVLSLLRDEQHTTGFVAGLHGSGLAVGAVAGGAAFPYLTRRVGRARVMWLALAGLACSIGALCLVRSIGMTLPSVVFASLFGNLLVCGVVATLTEQHGDNAAAALSEAHAVAAGLGILAPVAIGLEVRSGLGWRPALALAVVFAVAVAIVARSRRIALPDGRREPAKVVRTDGSRRRLPWAYWLAWAVMCMTSSVELCISLWAADVLRTHAGMSPSAASATLGAVMAGMLLGRLIGGRVALHIATTPLLLATFAVTAFGFAVFWLGSAGWVAATGLLAVGLGNALHYPLSTSLAMRAAAGQLDRAAGRASYTVIVGMGIAPLTLGWIADNVGPHRAFLILPVMLGAAAVLVLWLDRVMTANRTVGLAAVGRVRGRDIAED